MELGRGRQPEQQQRGTNGSRKGGKTTEDAYASLWATGKIDKPTWIKFAAGAVVGAQEASDAANMADELYMEMMDREALAVPSRK